MESESTRPCSQKPTTSACSELAKSSSQLTINILGCIPVFLSQQHSDTPSVSSSPTVQLTHKFITVF
jgi:hypothetical protein